VLRVIGFTLMLILLNQLLYSQAVAHFESLSLSENSFYLVCSGSNQKQGLIAEQFNISDKNATHVGIGVVEENVLTIYNVNSDQAEKSALSAEDFESFTSDRDLRYCSIWEYKSTRKEIRKLAKLLRSQLSKRIVFDMDFDVSNNKLYCSEFCCQVLNRWNPRLFAFDLTQKKLDPFYSKALGREILYYFPVDFFQANLKFKKIYEAFQQ
jgi:Permuted papain-like amidase enzyme, YaeF/YiiX, C92 family